MNNEQTNKKLDLFLLSPEFSFFDYVSEALWESLEDNVRRVALKYSTKESSTVLANYFKLIENEFVELSGIQKITVLNTNVIEAIFNRVMVEENVRSFYFDLFKSLAFKFSMDFDTNGCHQCFNKIIDSISVTPLNVQSINPRDTFSANVKLISDSLSTLIESKQNILNRYPWYCVIILLVIFYSTILEKFGALKTPSNS